jgi:hypothetical protein
MAFLRRYVQISDEEYASLPFPAAGANPVCFVMGQVVRLSGLYSLSLQQSTHVADSSLCLQTRRHAAHVV